ncbi:MAG: hypothetical protein HYS51_02565 [Candidatus Zambryskibacteria bacterium]|nr:hypothetical protein [Candidatus Zambryskibacteria bacterium]
MGNQLVSLTVMAVVTAIAIVVTIFRHELDSVRFNFFKPDPLAELKTLLPELGLELRDRLASLQFLLSHTWRNDGVKAIVPFFTIVSPWYDRLGKIRAIHQGMLKSYRDTTAATNLAQLCESLQLVGESLFRGMSKTRQIEEASEDNIFLGEIFGWPKPVWFWKKLRHDPKNYFLPGVQEMNPYDVVSVETRDFINAHAAKIIKAVDGLEAACQNRQPARRSILHFN